MHTQKFSERERSFRQETHSHGEVKGLQDKDEKLQVLLMLNLYENLL